MNEDSFRVAELLLSGMKCSHVLMMLALEAGGRDNPDLVRAMSGLAMGMGQGLECGALSGGCCVMGMLAGRGSEEETEDPRFIDMLDEYSSWFLAMSKERYGGSACADIIDFDPNLKAERCPALVADAWAKICDILDRQDIDLANPPQASEDAEPAL